MARRPLSDYRLLLVELDLIDETVLRRRDASAPPSISPSQRRAHGARPQSATLRRASQRTPSPFKLKQTVLSSRDAVDDDRGSTSASPLRLIADAIRENAAQRSRVLLELQDELTRVPPPQQPQRRRSQTVPSPVVTVRLLSPVAVKLLNRLRSLTLSIVEMIRYFHAQLPSSSGDTAASLWACTYEFQQTLARIRASDVDALAACPAFAHAFESLGVSAIRNPLLDGVALDASELLLCACQATSTPSSSSSLFQLVVTRLEAFALHVRRLYPAWQTLPHDRVVRALLDLLESETKASAIRMLPSYLRPDTDRDREQSGGRRDADSVASRTDSDEDVCERIAPVAKPQAWSEPQCADPPRRGSVQQTVPPVREVISPTVLSPVVAEPKTLPLVAAGGSNAKKKSTKRLHERSVTLGSLALTHEKSPSWRAETKQKSSETDDDDERTRATIASALDKLPQFSLEALGIKASPTVLVVSAAALDEILTVEKAVTSPEQPIEDASPRAVIEESPCRDVDASDDDDAEDHTRFRAAIASALTQLPLFSFESRGTTPPPEQESIGTMVSPPLAAAEEVDKGAHVSSPEPVEPASISKDETDGEPPKEASPRSCEVTVAVIETLAVPPPLPVGTEEEETEPIASTSADERPGQESEFTTTNTSELSRILSLCRDVHVAAMDLGDRVHPSSYVPLDVRLYHVLEPQTPTLSSRYLERELKMLRRCYRQWVLVLRDRHGRLWRLRVACASRCLGRLGHQILSRQRAHQQRIETEMATRLQRGWRDYSMRQCTRRRQCAFQVMHQCFRRYAFFTRVCQRQRQRYDAVVTLERWWRRVWRSWQVIERRRQQHESEMQRRTAAARQLQAFAKEQTLRRKLTDAIQLNRHIHMLDNLKRLQARKEEDKRRQLESKRLRELKTSLEHAVREMETKWKQAERERERLQQEQREKEVQSQLEEDTRQHKLARERIDRFLERSVMRRRLLKSVQVNDAIVKATRKLECVRDALERRLREDHAKRLLRTRMLSWQMNKKVQHARLEGSDALWRLQHKRQLDRDDARQQLHKEISARVAQVRAMEYCGVVTQTLVETTYRSRLMTQQDEAQRLRCQAARQRIAGFLQHCWMTQRIRTAQQEADARRREQREAEEREESEKELRRVQCVRAQSEWIVKHWVLQQTMRVRERRICETMTKKAQAALGRETQKRMDAEREAARLRNETQQLQQQHRRHEQLTKLQRRKSEIKRQQLHEKHARVQDATASLVEQQQQTWREELARREKERSERETQLAIERQTRLRLVDVVVETQTLAHSLVTIAIASALGGIHATCDGLTTATRYRFLFAQREACWRWRQPVQRRQALVADAPGPTSVMVDTTHPQSSRDLGLDELRRTVSARHVQHWWRGPCERRRQSQQTKEEQTDEEELTHDEPVTQANLSIRDDAEKVRTRWLQRHVRNRYLQCRVSRFRFGFASGRAWASTISAETVSIWVRFDRAVTRKLLQTLADPSSVVSRGDVSRLLQELALDLDLIVASAPTSPRTVVHPVNGSLELGDVDETELPRFALVTRQLGKTRSMAKRQQLLDAKTRPTQPSPIIGLTIFDAVESGSLEDAHFLLLQGADLHAREPCHQRTALHMLAFSRDPPLASRVAMLHFLLDRAKLDVHARDDLGETPLLTFAGRGCLALIQALLKRDATLWRERTGDGRNALYGACEQDQPEVAAWLQRFVLGQRTSQLEILKDLHARNADGWTPLHLLATRGHRECLYAVLSPLEDASRLWLLRERDGNGDTPLTLAIAHGQLDVTKDLLGLGASVVLLPGDAWQRRPLHYATRATNAVAMVSLLVESGADLNAVDVRGDTALHYAAASGRGAVVRHLLVLGADPTLLNGDWQRAAHVAASVECARLLLPSTYASSAAASLSYDGMPEDLLASAKSYCLPKALEPPAKVSRVIEIDWDELHQHHDVELVEESGHFSSEDEATHWDSDDD